MNSQDRTQFDSNQVKTEENIKTKEFMCGALRGGMVGADAGWCLAP